MAFFSSLVFTNTRVAGQRERQTLAYEAGTAYFPRDYPFNRPYESYASDREKGGKEIWERKPPAKRVNYEKLGIMNPWRASWRTVLGITEISGESKEGEVEFVSTQREQSQSIETNVRPWILRGSDVPNIVASMSAVFNHGAILHSEINRLRVKRGHTPFENSFKSGDLLQGALVIVKITMCSRGSPQDLAIIHSLSDDVYRKWEKVLNARRAGGRAQEQETQEETEVGAFAQEAILPLPDGFTTQIASNVPGQASTIGYVTTGHYSLARGHGFAIGAVPVVRLLELDQQVTRQVLLAPLPMLVDDSFIA
jgi:ribonuclease P/MRP protein subunit POP1